MPLDLPALKTTIQGIFDTANDSLASYDLSTGLSSRVKKVLTVHPQMVPIQPSYYPAVTMFYDRKEIETLDIGRAQMSTTRRADIDIKICGMLYKNKISAAKGDLADDEIEKLMENIEQVLRANDTLNNTVKWQVATGVTYHNMKYDEETFFRVGIMNVTMTLHY